MGEEEYDSWAAIFFNNLTSPKEMPRAIEECCQMMRQILLNSSLSEPFTRYTQTFLENNLNEALDVVLSQGAVGSGLYSLYISFLQLITEMIAFTVEFDIPKVALKLLNIFEPKNTFYVQNHGYHNKREARNQTSKSYSAIVNYFIKNQLLTIISLRLSNHQMLPTQDHFLVFFRIFNRFYSHYLKQERDNLAKISYQGYTAYLIDSQEAKSKGFDTHGFAEIFDIIFKLSTYFTEETNNVLGAALNFAVTCLRDEKLEKRLFGVQILSYYSESTVPFVINLFKEWAKQASLFDLLLGGDPHQEFLKKITPIMTTLATRGAITSDQLTMMWRIAQEQHISQRARMLPIIATVLKMFNEATISEFINEVTKNSVKPDTMRFLVSTAEGVSTKQELSKKIFTKVYEYAENEELLPSIKEAFQEQSKDFSQTVCQIAVEATLPMIKARKGGFASCISQIVKTVRSPSSVFTESYISLVKDLVFSINRKDGVLQYLQEIMKVRQIPADTLFVESLLTVPDRTPVWKFLKGLLDARSSVALEASAFSSIARFLVMNFNTENADTNFIAFAKSYLIAGNLMEAKIVNDGNMSKKKGLKLALPTKFVVRSVPLSYQAFLIKMMSENNNIQARRVLLDLYKSIGRSVYGSLPDFLIKQFQEHVKNKSPVSQLCIFIKELCQVLDANRLPDFGHLRHNDSYSSGDLFVKITFRQYKNDYKIIVPRDITLEDLYERISKRLGRPSSLQIKHGDVTIQRKGRLELTTLCDGGFVTIAMSSSKSIEDDNLPSIGLWRMDFTSNLLEHIIKITNPGDLKAMWELLISLPTDLKTKTEINNPESYIAKISKYAKLRDENLGARLIYRYLLRVLGIAIWNPDILEKFMKAGLVDVLIDSINQHPVGSAEVSNIIQTIGVLRLSDQMTSVVPALLRLLSTDKLDPKPQPILCKLLREYGKKESEMATLISDINIIEMAIQKVTNEAWPSFRSFVFELKNTDKLYQIAQKHMDEVRFIELYAHCIATERDGDIDKVITNCISCIQKVLDSETRRGVFKTICELLPQSKQKDDHVEKLLNIASHCGEEHLIKEIFSILSKTERSKPLTEFFDRIGSIVTDNWSFYPADNARSELGYCGLRNLGATCYINSVLQQLFHCWPFINAFFNTHLEREEDLVLKNLFEHMALTTQKASDPSNFLSLWKWPGNVPINTHEQQDAYEFMQELLDQLPQSANGVFKGKFINIIEGEDEPFRSESEENFYCVNLAVQGFKNMAESIDSFLAEEYINEYKSDEFGVIKVSKKSRILEAPPVLIVQLKRFDFDMNTLMRLKLQDRFEFPMELDISRLMVEDTIPRNYVLTGIVLHSGEAQAGHYNSLIKKGNSWIKFNDQEVCECIDVETEAFGGHSGTDINRSNAFILIYTAIEMEIDYDHDLKKLISEEVKKEIDKESSKFADEQCAFSPPCLALAIKAMDASELVRFFYAVFAHSKLEAYSNDITDRIDKICDENTGKALLKSFDRVMDVFEHCTTVQIVNASNRVLDSVLAKAPDSDVFEFANRCLMKLSTLQSQWRPVFQLSRCIERAVLRCPKEAISLGWPQAILDHVVKICSPDNSALYAQNVDCSPLISALGVLADSGCDTAPFKELIGISKQLMQSESQAKAFTTIIGILASMNVIPLSSLIKLIPSKQETTAMQVLIGVIEGTKSHEDASAIFQTFEAAGYPISTCIDHILLCLRDRNEKLTASLLKFASELIFPYLITDDPANIENIVTMLFPHAMPHSDLPKPKLWANNPSSIAMEYRAQNDEEKEKMRVLMLELGDFTTAVSLDKPIISALRLLKFLASHVSGKAPPFVEVLCDTIPERGPIASGKLIGITTQFEDGIRYSKRVAEISLMDTNFTPQKLRSFLKQIIEPIREMDESAISEMMDSEAWIKAAAALSMAISEEDSELILKILEIIQNINTESIRRMIQTIFFGTEQSKGRIGHFYYTFRMAQIDTIILDERSLSRIFDTLNSFVTNSKGHSRILAVMACLKLVAKAAEEGINTKEFMVRELAQYAIRSKSHELYKEFINACAACAKSSPQKGSEIAAELDRLVGTTTLKRDSGPAWFIGIAICKCSPTPNAEEFIAVYRRMAKMHSQNRANSDPFEMFEFFESQYCESISGELALVILQSSRLEYKCEEEFVKECLPRADPESVAAAAANFLKMAKVTEPTKESVNAVTYLYEKAYIACEAHPESVRRIASQYKEQTDELKDFIKRNQKLLKYVIALFE